MLGTSSMISNPAILEGKLSDIQIIECVREVYQDAELYGIYLFYMIHGLQNRCSEINFIIQINKLTDTTKLNLLIDKLRDSTNSLKIRSLSNRSEAFFQLSAKNRDITLVLAFGEPISYVSFSVNCLIQRNNEIDLLIDTKNQETKQQFKNLVEYDLENKNLRLIGDFKEHQTQYEIRICYHKLIRDLIGIFENFDGWKTTENLNFQLYDHHQADELCGICMENASKKHSFQLDCQHLFHVSCLAESMMELNPSASSCPICRKEILSYDYSLGRFKNWQGLIPLKPENSTNRSTDHSVDNPAGYSLVDHQVDNQVDHPDDYPADYSLVDHQTESGNQHINNTFEWNYLDT